MLSNLPPWYGFSFSHCVLLHIILCILWPDRSKLCLQPLVLPVYMWPLFGGLQSNIQLQLPPMTSAPNLFQICWTQTSLWRDENGAPLNPSSSPAINLVLLLPQWWASPSTQLSSWLEMWLPPCSHPFLACPADQLLRLLEPSLTFLWIQFHHFYFSKGGLKWGLRHPSPGSLEWSANFFFSNLPPTLLPE